MSDEGDKTCPLCAEEMDLTDQQLKPCKCGYEICVWCWHHLMDMAEKDATEGRCPACRTPYNKEKVVGTAATRERLVPEMNLEKKKSHKGKNKTSEGRKQLASVRVIQRNLVYVVGLPLDLADENVLQRKEYFGRYGKVLKVSISRTATGAIQHFANSTCSVYITYSKEEEAVRCIQSVHGFVLDGRPLKACFGTTKYCHAWLRNMPCSNPECLYLHEIGSQEDSFTKDEVISAYTRVQHIAGSSNSTQPRSGNVLPPPADEYCNNVASSGKPITKSAVNTNNSAINARVSPPLSSSGRSSNLPAGASWGTRASSNHPLLGSIQCSNEPVKQKSDIASNGSVACSTAAAGPSQFSLLRSGDSGNVLVNNDECSAPQDKTKIELSEPWKKESGSDKRTNVSESSSGSVHFAALSFHGQAHGQAPTEPPPNRTNIVDSSLMPNGPVACSIADAGPSQFSLLRGGTGKTLVLNEERIVSQDKSKIETLEPWKKESDADRRSNVSESSFGSVHSAALPFNRKAPGQPAAELQPINTSIVDSSLTPSGIASDKEPVDASDGNIKNICSDVLSMGINGNRFLEIGSAQYVREIVTSELSGTTKSTSAEVGLADVQPDLRLRMPTDVTQADLPETEDDLLSFEKQRIKDPEFSAIRKPDFPHASHLSNHYNIRSSQFNNAESLVSVDWDTRAADRMGNFIRTASNISIECPETTLTIPGVEDFEYSNLVPSKEKRLLPGRGEVANGAFDSGESSIISNILSMDLGSLEEPLTSPQNLAKFLGETDKRQGLGVSGSLKIHNSNQSRFSFAREVEPLNQGSDHIKSLGFFEQDFKQQLFSHDFSNGNSLQPENLVGYHSFPVINGTESDIFTGNHLNRLSGSRSQVSAPPGFSVPSRAPPPGFASHDRREPNLDAVSGNHMLDISSLSRNHYQAPSGGNNATGNSDIELIDPAILAVGKGVVPSGISSPGVDFRSNYSSQLSNYEEARFQSFLQRSLPQHLNQRYSDLGNSYSSLVDDPYRIPSRVMDQTLTNSLSPFSQFAHPQLRNGITSNGPWDGWNEIRSGNNLGIAELLRTEKLGFNKFYGGYEESQTRMPSSGNLYNGTYGI